LRLPRRPPLQVVQGCMWTGIKAPTGLIFRLLAVHSTCASSTVRCHSMACRRLASLRRLLGPFDTRCLVSHLRQLDVEEVSFKSPGNAQFARLSNEKRKKHLHPAAPRSEPAWRHYPGQFRCPLRPRQSGDGSAIPPQITRLALDGHCYLLRYCANSRGHDASSTPVLPRRAWRVAPMLLGTLAVSVTGLPPQK
jgi:hypothetical protein